MSILIKDINLPKEGEEITLAIFHDGDIVSYKYWLPKEAEAIQILKGHGRLIDADKLRAEFNRTESGYCGGWEFCDKPEDFQFLIDDEPTILEAEESR